MQVIVSPITITHVILNLEFGLVRVLFLFLEVPRPAAPSLQQP